MNQFTEEELRKWLEAEIALKTVELMEKNQELETAMKKLESLDKTKNEFLRIISHEIRTPLNGIKGSIFLLKEGIVDPVQQEFVEMLETSISRLDHFALTALQIAGLQSSGKPLEKSMVTLREITAELNSFKDRHAKPVQFEIDTDPSITDLAVNKNLFLTALINIYRNAIHFSPPEGKIRMTVTREEEGIHLVLTDEGPGFSEAVLLHKFEPFVTGETHMDENPGLSLALVKYIIEAHGGKADLYNQATGGAVVDFFIPAT